MNSQSKEKGALEGERVPGQKISENGMREPTQWTMVFRPSEKNRIFVNEKKKR